MHLVDRGRQRRMLGSQRLGACLLVVELRLDLRQSALLVEQQGLLAGQAALPRRWPRCGAPSVRPSARACPCRPGWPRLGAALSGCVRPRPPTRPDGVGPARPALGQCWPARSAAAASRCWLRLDLLIDLGCLALQLGQAGVLALLLASQAGQFLIQRRPVPGAARAGVAAACVAFLLLRGHRLAWPAAAGPAARAGSARGRARPDRGGSDSLPPLTLPPGRTMSPSSVTTVGRSG